MALKLMFKGLWQNVWFANKIMWKQLRPQVFYNHYPSQVSAGRRFPWISSQVYQKSEGKSVIMVIVDRLTKYAHFCALSHPFKASTVSTAFMETVQKLHGSPKIIVSDRDPIFTGHFWTELFSCLGTQLAHSSSYHPQSDGQTEIVNKCLEGYLRCFVSDKQTQWFKWLPLAEWWYNTSFHTTTKMTPFMALYGYHPPSITSSLK
jgi:transposase InsO family protein